MQNRVKRSLVLMLSLSMIFSSCACSSCSTDGSDGKSAYELAVDNGFKGTVEEWLASLAGENGSVGPRGERGASAYEIAVEKGYTGSEEQWLTAITGIDGRPGKDGADGRNGRDGVDGAQGPQGEKGEAGAQGPQGEKGETGARGPQGEKGETGAAGTNGSDGKSAYTIAVENGFNGTLSEWLGSLVGEKGDKGDQGNQGEKGDKGDKGDPGEVTEEELIVALYGKANAIIDTASGAVASFPDGTDAPVADLTAAIVPVRTTDVAFV